MTPVYRGVVKNGVIELIEPAELPDGAIVEVRLSIPPLPTPEEDADEDAFERYLLEKGAISRIPDRLPDPPGLDRTPIEVPGRPLSEIFIEERR
jgi:hypothetical protein